MVNGWLVTSGTGDYGTNYLLACRRFRLWLGRELARMRSIPARKRQRWCTLDGANTYIMHFAKGETPPVDGFWSITMYEASYYFYPNSLNKLTVSMRDHPEFNADGSLDLYFSHDKPANAPQANWLPAPAVNSS